MGTNETTTNETTTNETTTNETTNHLFLTSEDGYTLFVILATATAIFHYCPHLIQYWKARDKLEWPVDVAVVFCLSAPTIIFCYFLPSIILDSFVQSRLAKKGYSWLGPIILFISNTFSLIFDAFAITALTYVPSPDEEWHLFVPKILQRIFIIYFYGAMLSLAASYRVVLDATEIATDISSLDSEEFEMWVETSKTYEMAGVIVASISLSCYLGACAVAHWRERKQAVHPDG